MVAANAYGELLRKPKENDHLDSIPGQNSLEQAIVESTTFCEALANGQSNHANAFLCMDNQKMMDELARKKLQGHYQKQLVVLVRYSHAANLVCGAQES